ncbi:MAG: response regulator [Desulfobacteraceae bacterium]|nr:response regulator [Desulfobacteraceae bacterium]
MKEYEILLVDDDPIALRAFGSNLEAEGYSVTTVDNGQDSIEMMTQKNYDLVLTDLIMRPIDGIAVLKKVKELNSDTMVIILTGHADVASAIDALRLNADDYLLKSCKRDELSFRVARSFEKLEYRRKVREMEEALRKSHAELERRVKERTLKLADTADKLKRKQKELLNNKDELEKLNNELMDTNKALSVLAKNIERKKEEAEKKIALTISSKAIPLIEYLRKDKSLNARHKAELDILASYMYDLTSGLEGGAEAIIPASPLSLTESRVVAMIRNGLTNNEIANQMNVSPLTVKSHCKTIRRKLNIKNPKITLKNYLRSKILPGD